MPIGRLLKHARTAQQPLFLERRRLQLQADRQARLRLSPHGKQSPGMPARFALTVYRSTRYIDSGSSAFSPILNAGAAVTGPAIRSTFANAWSKSCRISRRTFSAFR